MSKNILISGANRGIGLEFTRELSNAGHNVIACCRQPENAVELLTIAQENTNVQIQPLDVCSEKSIKALRSSLQNHPIDWLINNAGISGEQGVTVGNIHSENFLRVLHTNCVGAIQLADALLDNLVASNDKVVVNITSRMGSISDNTSGHSYAYRASKAALNAVMRSFAIDVQDLGVNVILIHPGWVQTRMGGEEGMLTPEESVSAMLKVIEKHRKNAHAETILRFDGDKIDW